MGDRLYEGMNIQGATGLPRSLHLTQADWVNPLHQGCYAADFCPVFFDTTSR